MRIIFLNGGFLNDQGPFEPGEAISVSEADGLQLIANGSATAVPRASARPVTITITTGELSNGDV